MEALDRRRLHDYFVRILGGDVPPEGDAEEWRRWLQDMDFATASAGRVGSTAGTIPKQSFGRPWAMPWFIVTTALQAPTCKGCVERQA